MELQPLLLLVRSVGQENAIKEIRESVGPRRDGREVESVRRKKKWVKCSCKATEQPQRFLQCVAFFGCSVNRKVL